MLKLNGRLIEFDTFPNGEIMLKTANLVRIVYQFDTQYIVWKWEGDADLFKLIVMKKYLDDIGCKSVVLSIVYMPYSRMDRTGDIYAFTLKYMCSVINWLDFSKVIVTEPHSDVTLALLDRSEFFKVTLALISKLLCDDNIKVTHPGIVHNPFIVVLPDKGALQRYGTSLQDEYKCITLSCEKTRDFKTGRITGMNVDGDIGEQPFPGRGYHVIIVDDLCSRGGTFILAAQAVINKFGSSICRINDMPQIHLVVAHCENTIHDGDVLNIPMIADVWTTNSIVTDNRCNNRLHIVDMF